MVFSTILHVLAYIGLSSTAPSPFEVDQGLVANNLGLLSDPASEPLLPYEYWGRLNFDYEFKKLHPVNISGTQRVSVRFLGGNWTDTKGHVIAKVLPNIGGEQGYWDKKNNFHLDVRQTIQFVSDGKYGYVQLKGFRIKTKGPGTISIETDSADHQKWNNQILYALGGFVSTGVSAPIWAVGPPGVPE
ncbi:uncharacterized protein EI90DRAFT_1788409 [Cantharellus anzutake]|uniref:uncharacterized protein n=1 Tax=Cantharellus anzutake TaxID=1750568 RepID=UPI0019073FB8|nr:uncharacterized protein EI90DRAFT_1788409 [Cantharellus anzutake]KAF8327378.1 hypothetical protein EI90DRAFT_1788409 [Cantharellus anzutake]